ncbi:MAG TPA: DUF1289 domain-containing protein [Ramlibacter sp.]|jgi:hypothetical protein|nr:DUF1289 domain-containing protein [Ramlibacter sp.]
MSSREPLKKQAQRVAAGEVTAVPSPCMSICRMDMDTGLCEGCLRTLDEIAAWGRMSEEEKRDVWTQLSERIAKEQA